MKSGCPEWESGRLRTVLSGSRDEFSRDVPSENQTVLSHKVPGAEISPKSCLKHSKRLLKSTSELSYDK